jgi:sulfite exporter TauE/SafE
MSWSALLAGSILGLAGSLHCVGMCGPLMLLLPNENRWISVLKSQGIYHLGRTLTYVILGSVAGLLFLWIDIRSVEQQFSLALGLAFLFLWIYDFWGSKGRGSSKLQLWVQNAFGKALKKHETWGWFLGGLLNGLLPCGLVYGALLASLSTGSNFGTITFMAGFGLASAPALIGVSLSKAALMKKVAPMLRKALPFWLLIMALVFLLRGANLGIPFLSPKFQTQETLQNGAKCCH